MVVSKGQHNASLRSFANLELIQHYSVDGHARIQSSDRGLVRDDIHIPAAFIVPWKYCILD